MPDPYLRAGPLAAVAASLVAGFVALSPLAARADEPPPAPPAPTQAPPAPAGSPAPPPPAAAQSAQPAPAPAPPGAADTAAAQHPQNLEERVHELEETVRQLKGVIEDLKQKPAAPAPAVSAQVEKIVDDRLKKQKPLVGWDRGFFVRSEDGNFNLKIRGLIQSDARAFTSDRGRTGLDSFYLRRVRPILEGTVYKYIDFRLMPDFGLGTTVLQDAYLNFHYWPEAQVRFGKFKEPVSLERLQSAEDILFVERSIADNLQPNRDVGVQLHGDLLRGTVGYALGAFNGVNDGGSSEGDTNNDKDIAGRLFVQPFKNQSRSPLQGLGVGVAGSFGGRDDALTGFSGYRTSGRSTFFKYATGVSAAGDHSRVSPQGYFYYGPFGLMGEYVASSQELSKGAARTTADNNGWFVQASYILTGEKASYRNPTPKREFDPRKGQWGAFEVAASYSRVNADRDLFSAGFADPAASARSASAFTFGLNWYLNRALKVQLNYERTDFNRAIKFGSLALDHEDVFLSRFQVSF